MAKELSCIQPPTGLGLECFGLIGANAARSGQQIGSTINDCHYCALAMPEVAWALATAV